VLKMKMCGAVAATLLWTGAAMAQATVELEPGFSVDKELLAKAQKEGKVSYWCSLTEPECAQAAKRFEEISKIKVEFVRLSTGGMLTRITKERSANIHSVDIISHGDPPVWETIYKPKKWLVQYVAEGVKKYSKEYKDAEGFYAAHWMIANGFGYNTSQVSAADVPKKYTDLLDPRWKGKIAMPHPKHSGGFNEAVTILSKMFGWDFFQKLNANQPLVTIGSQFNLKPIIVNGERQIALHGADALFISEAKKGSPVGIIYPEEGTVINQIFCGLVADGPNPNAGKVLMEWLHSASYQTTVAASYWLVPHPDATYPTDRVPLKDLKVLTLPGTEAQSATEAREKFSDIFGG
jgi:iron(III) transport system substrate-binding protein